MRIAVYGASGTTGALIAAALHDRGADVVLAGRDEARLRGIAAGLPGARVAVAPVDDALALATAFAGADCVVACAGPFGAIGEPVMTAAIAAGAHYVDTAGEQAFLRAMYERHEAAARRAGVCAIGGMAFEIALGDLAAGWAAAALGPGRLAEVTVTYVLDEFAPTPGTALSAIATMAEPGVVWQRDRWDPVAPAAERRRINAGAAHGGDRDVVSFPSGEVITVPRHVEVDRVQTFVSLTRGGWEARAARWASPLLSALGKTALPGWLAAQVPATPPDAAARARAAFTVIARARRGFADAQVAVSGRDVYATTAAITAWAATALARRDAGPTGVLAPSEAFAPADTLAALAQQAALTVVTSFS